MKIEYDPRKNERNLRERGLSFERAAEFDFDNPEWTDEDFVHAKKFSELPEEQQRVLRAIMEENAVKKKVAAPLSREVVEKMQSTGEGWELRVEEAVRQWLERRAKRRKVAS
ncbi:MAG: BrnA antitoxin family protein [Acidobacteriaceae bacterium]